MIYNPFLQYTVQYTNDENSQNLPEKTKTTNKKKSFSFIWLLKKSGQVALLLRRDVTFSANAFMIRLNRAMVIAYWSTASGRAVSKKPI
ncbi:hypothetical protein PU57_03265 [Escherichia coli]|nr:hypothetical protein PU57_03265 [Escherichia coli]